MAKTIKKASLDDELKKVTERNREMSIELKYRFARIIVEEGLLWLESEEGKKEVLRLRTNKSHRDSYHKKKSERVGG